jgi:hypothetical protein
MHGLCDAKAAINASGCAGEYSMEEVSIDEDPALQGNGNDIPVIFINGVKVLTGVDPRSQARKLGRLART